MEQKLTWGEARSKLAGMGNEVDFSADDVAKIVADRFPDGLPLRKGWRQKMGVGPDGISIRIYNPMLAAKGVPEAFYAVQNLSHPYGAPLIDEEPSLGIPRSDMASHHIIGVIVEDENGNVVLGEDKKPLRFSWSNLFNQGRKFGITEGGEFILDGKSCGFVQVLYLANKNRIRPEWGWIAGVGPGKPNAIRLKEVEDVKLTKL